jgi:hypothetical protein
MTIKTILWSSITALALLGASPLAAAHGPSHSRAKSLVGTWQVTITPYVCTTGELLTAFAVGSYMTFGEDGTVAEATSNPAFQPGQRSSGFGFWERTGGRSYRAVFEAFVQFTSVVTPPTLPRYQRGKQRVDQDIELVGKNHWESTASVSFFDTAGTAVPPSGCAVAEGQRMQ